MPTTAKYKAKAKERFIKIVDVETEKIYEFNNAKLAAYFLKTNTDNLNNYINTNRLYQNKYRVESGVYHEKKVKIEIELNEKILSEILKIQAITGIKNRPRIFLDRFINTCGKDYLNYLRNID